jgi:predicted dienelactone hydrolase
MLQRTNDSSDALNYLDPGATNFEKRFYRTATNFLVTPFPKPSGPYSVGTFSRLMTDPSRIRHTLPTNSSFMVTFWYPAEGKTGALPNTYFEKELTVLFPEYWIDARCKAVVLLDVGLLGGATNLIRLGLHKPFLSMHSTIGPPTPPDYPFGSWLDDSLVFFAKATNDAFWFQIQDSTHASFADRGSVINDPTLTSDPTPVSRGISQTIRACTLSFFDKYLKGEDNHLLDNPAAVYPNVINFQRK